MMVADARDTEAGIYTCRAANAYGHVDTSAAVEVVRPGSVRGGRPAMFMSRPDQDMTVTLGEDITISFRVQGDPKPRGMEMGFLLIENGSFFIILFVLVPCSEANRVHFGYSFWF